ncbi:cupin domain-containing protein [Salinicola endophyticus]|uniref:Cupin domain-containing protein n=1 Tax=Salinicola endophyticus TaxID=1949083 RepID=A0ABY8FH59_9GAMM|nr:MULTISPECIES: cupin domain-containing protein [Salinicola]WFF42154.1 cupin domain-containing protein [Salinicola endophyticus]
MNATDRSPKQPPQLPWSEIAARLAAAERPFVEVFARHELVLELFSPRDIDTQTPHARDELYLIASGSAVLNRDGERLAASVGDVLFVPKGMPHRFDTFSADFSTWVLFFGPE